MKMKTKLLPLLLALALCLSLLPVTAMAAGEEYSLDLTVNGAVSATVAPGGSVTVKLALTNNAVDAGESYDLYTAQDYVTFDTAYFTVDETSVEPFSVGGSPLFHASPVHFYGAEHDRVYVNRVSASARSVDKTIVLLTFTLTVKPGVSSGTTTISHDTIEVLTGGGDALSFTSSNATVTIDAYVPPTPPVPPAPPSGPSGGEKPEGAPVIVDGQSYEIGSVTVDESTDTTSVIVDHVELEKQIESASDYVRVPISADTSVAAAQFVVADVEKMQVKEMTLIMDVGDVQYSIPSAAVDTDALEKAFPNVSTSAIPFIVTVADTPADENALVKQAVINADGELVLPAIDFTVVAEYGGKTVEVELFKHYTARIAEVTAEQARRVTTAVVYETDGSLRHVPTQVFMEDGKWYARINSLTNSTYALIYNEQSFTDDDGKWFEAVVTKMASRKVINGRGEGVFDGEAYITRAEFAAILVRALGLPENGDASAFTDVAGSAWYYGAVGKAYEYGLIEGRGGGIFDPQANISRQEAMAMVHRAAAITELVGAAGTLAAFSDADSISPWALADAQWNVGSGLIQGSNGMINGLNNITRGETATIILRLLQKSELVDVRTKA